MIHEAYRIVGTPRFGGILIVSDHASNRVPAGIDLGIPPELLNEHIAIDIGVGAIGRADGRRAPGIAAFQGNVSRLVCDFNRDEEAPARGSRSPAMATRSPAISRTTGFATSGSRPITSRITMLGVLLEQSASGIDPVAPQLHAAARKRSGASAPVAGGRALQPRRTPRADRNPDARGGRAWWSATTSPIRASSSTRR